MPEEYQLRDGTVVIYRIIPKEEEIGALADVEILRINTAAGERLVIPKSIRDYFYDELADDIAEELGL